MTQTLNTMSLRAEFQHDIAKLLKVVPVRRMELLGDEVIPDTVVQFDTPLTLDEVKIKIMDIEDGHVMFDTIAQATIQDNPMERNWQFSENEQKRLEAKIEADYKAKASIRWELFMTTCVWLFGVPMAPGFTSPEGQALWEAIRSTVGMKSVSVTAANGAKIIITHIPGKGFTAEAFIGSTANSPFMTMSIADNGDITLSDLASHVFNGRQKEEVETRSRTAYSLRTIASFITNTPPLSSKYRAVFDEKIKSFRD